MTLFSADLINKVMNTNTLGIILALGIITTVNIWAFCFLGNNEDNTDELTDDGVVNFSLEELITKKKELLDLKDKIESVEVMLEDIKQKLT